MRYSKDAPHIGVSPTVEAIYERLAPLYDLIYGATLDHGRRHAMTRLAPSCGESILEIGVGTGLSALHYPRGCRVVAIDLSAHMIGRARLRLARRGVQHVSLCRMDAAHLAFQDAQFDAISAPYVMNIVSDPARVARAMLRVCRPSGRLVLLNPCCRSGPSRHCYCFSIRRRWARSSNMRTGSAFRVRGPAADGRVDRTRCGAARRLQPARDRTGRTGRRCTRRTTRVSPTVGRSAGDRVSTGAWPSPIASALASREAQKRRPPVPPWKEQESCSSGGFVGARATGRIDGSTASSRPSTRPEGERLSRSRDAVDRRRAARYMERCGWTAGGRLLRVLVSLHDVTPVHQRRIERAERLFGELDVSEVLYLLVPNSHRTAAVNPIAISWPGADGNGRSQFIGRCTVITIRSSMRTGVPTAVRSPG